MTQKRLEMSNKNNSFNVSLFSIAVMILNVHLNTVPERLSMSVLVQGEKQDCPLLNNMGVNVKQSFQFQ